MLLDDKKLPTGIGIECDGGPELCDIARWLDKTKGNDAERREIRELIMVLLRYAGMLSESYMSKRPVRIVEFQGERKSWKCTHSPDFHDGMQEIHEIISMFHAEVARITEGFSNRCAGTIFDDLSKHCKGHPEPEEKED